MGRELHEALVARQTVSRRPRAFAAGDIEDAYAVQNVNTTRWEAAGRRLVGKKIGPTSKAVQSHLGVRQPDYGMLFDDMDVPDGWEMTRSQLIQPKAEAEIAFVLGRDLTDERHHRGRRDPGHRVCPPAIEIVDCRITDWKIKHHRHRRRQCFLGPLCAGQPAQAV